MYAASTLVDGRIVESWGNWDMMGMLQQLGAIPARPAPPKKPKRVGMGREQADGMSPEASE
jgi:hypothetical protein